MPKQGLPITRFNLGMVTSIDPQDIPLESAIYSENLDGNAHGRLQGILSNSLKSSTIGENAVGINNWLRRETGEHDLIYTDNTNIKSIRDFYGTPSENTEIASKVPTSMVRMNRGMHMGTGSASDKPPQFLGWGGDFSPFGGIGLVTFTGTGNSNLDTSGLYTGAADATYHIKITVAGTPDKFQYAKDAGAYNGVDISITSSFQSIAEGLQIRFNATTGHVVNDVFDIIVYAKKVISMITDSGQLGTYLNLFEVYVSGDYVKFQADTASSDPGAYNRRITAVNIYRSDDIANGAYRWKFSLIYDGIQETLLSTQYAERAGTGAYDEDNAGLYRLAKSVLIADGDEWIGSTASNLKIFEIEDFATSDAVPTSVSYEQNSGILENADTNMPYYELGCTLNNFHFVAKCYVDKIPDAKMMLFRSVEFCYDVFDIYNDKVPLNILPTAIAGFNNKIYVWDSNTTIIINASSLSIENIILGTGCSSPLSWTIIDTLLDDKPYRALVWADTHDIYMDEGAGARPISDAIRTRINSNTATVTISWTDMQHTSMNPILVFDAPKNTLLCISSVNYAGNIASVLAYNIISKRWDYYPDFCNYSATSRLCKAAFSGKDGETYCVNGYQVLNNFAELTPLTGSIDPTASTSVVGVGTLFTTELVVGDRIVVSGETRVVATITDNTHLTVTVAFSDNANDTSIEKYTTNRAWKYFSPELTFDLPKQPKEFYNMYLDEVETIGTITPIYSIDKGTTYRSLTNGTEIKDAGGLWEKKNSIILSLVGTAGVNWVNAIELLYRKMVGVR